MAEMTTRTRDKKATEEVVYRMFDTPHGAMLAAVTAGGLVRLAFDIEDFAVVLEELGSAVGTPVEEDEREGDNLDETLDGAVAELGEYFSGQRQSFDVPLDLRLVDGFRRSVIDEMRRIPYGTTTTYAEVATAVGNPKAVRAVGSTCSHNPIPVMIPCHRVLRSDGRSGEYLAGSEVKAALLRIEGSRL